MSAKITGPYGTFNQIADAAREIAHTRGPEFIKQYPNYNFPYSPAKQEKYKDHTGENGHNNSSIHYIYHAIHDMIGPVGSPGRNGWRRV